MNLIPWRTGRRARRRAAEHPNWLLKVGLGTVSFAIAAIGVFGWLYRANVFAAWTSGDPALLSPLWPFYAAAAFGCLASQIVVACAGANFHRHKPGTSPATRAILILAIVVFAAFATVGAENGWMIATGAQQRIEAQARDGERAALTAEIKDITARIKVERDKLPDAATTLSGRMNAAVDAFKAATADDSARLPAARHELASKPPLPADRDRTPFDWFMMAAFLAYQLSEPWFFYAAEQGRRPHTSAGKAEPARILEPAPKLTEELTSPPEPIAAAPAPITAPTPQSQRSVAKARSRPAGAQPGAEIYDLMDRVYGERPN